MFIIIINSQKLPIIGTGDMPIIINNIKVLITGVNYIPNIKNTLISSKELTNKGWSIYFKNNIVIIQNNNFTFKAN